MKKLIQPVKNVKDAISTDLIDFAKILENIPIEGEFIETFPIHNAAKNIVINSENCWEYSIKGLKIPLPTPKKYILRHLKPDIKPGWILISTTLKGDCQYWSSKPEMAKDNPFKEAYFSVQIVGTFKGNDYQTGFHLDLCKLTELASQEIHPSYHIQFAPNMGSKIDDYDDSLQMGHILTCDVPRFVHLPLDFILGFDYVLASYMPTIRHHLLKDRIYSNLLRKYQNIIWKPYFEQICTLWKPDRSFVSKDPLWQPNQLLPYLIT